MLSSTSFNRYRYGRRGGFGRCYYKTNFKNRCRRQNEHHIIFYGGFNQDDQLKMNGFNCGCKNIAINHTASYNFDTTIRDRTLDMVARDLYYDEEGRIK